MLKRNGKYRNGYTLVELIVSIVIVVILLGAIMLGIVSYSRYAHFKKLNEYAADLFNAAQTQLTYYSQQNNLDNLQNVTMSDFDIPITSLKDTEGNNVDSSIIWKDVDRYYQGTLRYIVGTKDDYTAYLNGTLGNDRNSKALKVLYDIFDSYLYNKDILKATICVEFDPYEGLVYSVLYSDLATDFTYTDHTGGHVVNICDRSYDYRKDNMVGYYGVDCLSKSTSTEVQKPIISNVLLNNGETLKLSFNVTKVSEAVGILNYNVIIYDSETKEPLVSILFNDITLCQNPGLDTANYNLVAENSVSNNCTIKAEVINYTSQPSVTGLYTFPAWITSDGYVNIILDAVDMGATEDRYLSGELSDTYSLHRFDINANNIYCTVQGSGSGYKTTAKKQSNSESAYFGKYTESFGNVKKYTILNSRHLYNIRFSEAYNNNDNINYTVAADFSWTSIIKNGNVYTDQHTLASDSGLKWLTSQNLYNYAFTTDMLKIKISDSDVKKAFPSIKYLNENSVFCSASSAKPYIIKDMILSRLCNDNYSINIEKDSTGLFLNNKGIVKDICFDDIVVTGINNVGSICGINNGLLQNIKILNTNKNSSVSGQNYVGGIVGIQDSELGSSVYKRLLNRATVSGYNYVGGIISSLYADFTDVDITVDSCTNYGIIKGQDVGNNESRYIGGIVGYVNAAQGNIKISSCTGSSQYSDDEIFNNELNREFSGVFVGGIVGYNFGGKVYACNSINEFGKQGYVLGSRFVGGIVGYNSNLEVTVDGRNNINQANVIGKEYVGGIVGCNATLDIRENPITQYSDNMNILNWINSGVVIATERYSGGVTGYNSGNIFNCGSSVDYNNNAQSLMKFTDFNGDFSGGISGYNSGKIIADSNVSVVCVVKGGNYVGGVVGYISSEEYCEVSGYELQGGYISGDTFVGGYAGLNSSQNVLEDNDKIVANANEVTGNYFVGGTLGGSIVPAVSNINTSYNVYNILGSVNGKQFVGGFIGYCQLVEKDVDCLEYSKNIANKFTDDYYHNVSVLDNIHSTSKFVQVIDGGSSELRLISGDVFVAGTVGYTNSTTNIYIRNVINRTKIVANTYLDVDEVGNGYTSSFSYAGGVIGKIQTYTVVDNCYNTGAGEIISEGEYLGGIAEINKGLVVNCISSNIGNNSKNNVGGLVGINCPSLTNVQFGSDGYVQSVFDDSCIETINRIYTGVYNCGYTGSITGNNNVGGIVSQNYGMIYNPKAQGKVIGYGDNIGGIVSINNGIIDLKSENKVAVKSNGENVGGIVGVNKGNIIIDSDSDASKSTTSTSSYVIGNKNIGGIIGIQCTSIDLSGCVNNANVTSQNGNSSGIIGALAENTVFSNLKISNCINSGLIKSDISGDSAGILSSDAIGCEIKNCFNTADISAVNGNAGGICSYSYGTISECAVAPLKIVQNSDETLFTNIFQWIRTLLTGQSYSSININGNGYTGSISGINNGKIITCNAMYVNVQNFVTSDNGGNLGGIAGKNNSEIILSENGFENISVSTYTNECYLGGITGINNGNIYSDSEQSDIGNNNNRVSIKFSSSSGVKGIFGGVSGVNYGTIKQCNVYAEINGNRGDSVASDYGYGGIAGVNKSNIYNCNFDGIVYADGNNSFIACIGGISGVNDGDINNCAVGITQQSKTIIQCGEDISAYGYVGGMVGYNRGTIKNCDNYANSLSEVYILNYAGHTGALVGRNYNKAVITGTDENNITSTGKNWEVVALRYDNDCGAGGIMGYSSSGENISYVYNYANVYYMLSAANVSVGGIVGRIENAENSSTVFSNCINYGNIAAGSSYIGGFIGTLKYNGITFYKCINYGQISAPNSCKVIYTTYDGNEHELSLATSASNSSGFISRVYLISLPEISGGDGYNTIYYISCENHGAIYGNMASGMFGLSVNSDMLSLYFTDCINTGCIYSGGNQGAGICIGTSKYSNLSFIRCRNYGLCNDKKQSQFGGIYYGTTDPTVMKDCFDASNATLYPISNRGSNNKYSENYYLSNSSHTEEKSHIEIVKDTFTNAQVNNNYNTDGSNLVQNNYPLSNAYDGNLSLASSSARLDFSSTPNNSNANIDFILSQSSNISSFDIYWGNNGDNKTYRKYKYKLYYLTDASDEWYEASGSDSSTDGPIYKDGYYIAIGYPSTRPVSDSTYTHVIANKTQSKIRKIRIAVQGVESSLYQDSQYSYNPYVVIGEVYAKDDTERIAITSSEISRDSINISSSVINSFDGDNNTSTKLSTKSAATSMYQESVDSTSEIIYDIANPVDLDYIGILWGFDSLPKRYVYKLFYQTSGNNDWHEVTSNNVNGEFPISYDTVNSCYVAYTGDSGSENMYYHSLDDLVTGGVITKVKLKIISSSILKNGKYTLDNSVIINEVCALKTIITQETVSDELYDVKVGLPAVPVKNEDNYIIKNGNEFYLNNIDIEPTTEYKKDWSSWDNHENSYRYKLYEAIEKSMQSYFKNKYNIFTGNININSIQDTGNNIYKVDWKATNSAYMYEVSYKVLDSNDSIIVNMGSTVYNTYLNSYTISIPEKYIGYKVVFGVRALYYENENSDEIKYSDWYNSESVVIKSPLPIPQIHLELVYIDNNYRYRAVLDNQKDYYQYGEDNIAINVSVGTINVKFLASQGYSDATINITSKSNYSIVFSASDNNKIYGNSAKRMVQSMLLSPSSMNSTDFVETTFNGFYGRQINDLYYTVTTDIRNSAETYYYVEFIAHDSDVGSNIAVSYSESHVANYSQSLTASLANLPKDLITYLIDNQDEYICVRSYPWRTQAYMSYLGNVVVSNADIETVKSMDIFQNSQLKPGYDIQKNVDGTYNVVYSTILANTEYFDEQIDSIKYSAKLINGKYYIVSDTGYKVPIQNAPNIDTNCDYNAITGEYTFSWDKDSKQDDSLYNVTLFGVLNGIETEIDSFETDKNSAIFVDDNWNYPDVKLVVERIGSYNNSLATTSFGNSSSQYYNLKIRLPQISEPSVSPHMNDNGVIEKNDLIYDVTWTPVVNSELKCYEITISYVDEENNKTTIVYRTGELFGKIYLNGVDTGITCNAICKSELSNSVVLNLNYLAAFGGKDATVSIKAIASDDATTYRNGADGVIRTVKIPTRLSTPDMTNLVFSSDSIVSATDFEENGVTFTMSQSYTDKGNYEMVLEIVDELGNHVADVKVANKIVSKDNPISMRGNLVTGSYNLTGISADYAGMYIKVYMRAVADSNISSVWTTDDDNVKKTAIYRLPIVKTDTPNILESSDDVIYKHDSENPLEWDTIGQKTLSFNTVKYADSYVITIVNTPRNVYINKDMNHRKSDIHIIKLKKNGDAFDVYYISTAKSIYSIGTETKIGSVADSELVLPIDEKIVMVSQTSPSEEMSLDVNAFLNYENGTFKLILPDTDDTFFTQNVTIQSIAYDHSNYNDSDYSSWYRYTADDKPATNIYTFDKLLLPQNINKDSFAVNKSDRTGIEFELSGKTPYLSLFEISVDTDGDGVFELVKLYSAPGNNLNSYYDSILLLDSATWNALEGKDVSVRIRYITDNMGLSEWSNSIVYPEFGK